MSMQAVKAVATAAVVCGVICGAALSAWTAARHAPASAAASASLSRPGSMPGFYVVIAGLEVVVRASSDGHVTGSVAIPGSAESGREWVAAEVFGGQDDRHFVIAVSWGSDLFGVAQVVLFRLAISPDGRPGRLAPLGAGFDRTGEPLIGAALSPDGSMLALSLVHEFPAGPLYGIVEIINLVTGGTRTWAGQSRPGDWAGVPAWASDRTVVVPWWHSTSAAAAVMLPPGMIPAVVTGIRQIDAAQPGGSLAAARLAAFPVPVRGLRSAVITPGGGEVVASSCRAAGNTATAQVVGLSAANGRLIGVLGTYTARFSNADYALGSTYASCQVLSVTGDGDHVLIQAFAFGRIDNGVFTALPGTPTIGVPVFAKVFAAW